MDYNIFILMKDMAKIFLIFEDAKKDKVKQPRRAKR